MNRILSHVFLLVLSSILLTSESSAQGGANFSLGDGSVRVWSAGPLQITAGKTSVLIGLLLPAVQKVRGAVVVMNLKGEVIFMEEFSPDETGDSSPFQSHQHELSINPRTNQLEVGDGSVKKELGLTNGTESVAIGLLLPAVQKVREAAARVSPKTPIGSLQLMDLNSKVPVAVIPLIEQDSMARLTQFIAKQSVNSTKKTNK